jgi:hypothetical protein
LGGALVIGSMAPASILELEPERLRDDDAYKQIISLNTLESRVFVGFTDV